MPTSNPKLEVYKASAGSGKTFQLALRYISLLLGERQEDGSIRLYTHGERKMHREILAITFTNKATNEMKQRIIKELTLLANVNAESDYRKTLMEATGASAAQLAQAAGEALTSMLFDYGKMQVSTIDAFFQRILRSFAYEADLTGNYELSLDNEGLIKLAIADTLTQVCGFKSKTALGDKRVARIRRWIEQIIDDKYTSADNPRVFDNESEVRTTLAKFIFALSGESYQTNSAEIDKFFNTPNAIDNLIDALRKKQKDLKIDIDAKANEILLEDGNNILNNRGPRSWIEGLLQPKMPEPSAAFANYIRGKNDVAGMCKGTQATLSILDNLNVLVKLLRQYRTVGVMLKQMYNLGLFHEVLDVAARMKVHLNTILLSDTNTMLHEIIGNSDTPFIYERIGEQLHHFLIDEFQDTSKLQWLNLHPLVTNSLGSGYDNMIIGDVKQCIYRFRNSYPELLDTELESDDDLNYAVTLPQINTNWRSAKEVVNFNNDLFEAIGRQKNIPSYGGVRQQYASDAPDGYVDVASSDNFASDYVTRMVENMRRQLDSGYSPSDIVVLVRTHVFGSRIVKALLEHTVPGAALEGIPIVSSESLYLKNANSVKFIIAQLRELDRIWNPASMPEQNSGRSTLPRATDREMDWLQESLRRARKDGLAPEEAIEQVLKDFDNFNHKVALTPTEEDSWRERMRGRALFEIVEELILNLPEPEWRRTEAQFIAAFQDLIAEHSHYNAPTIGGFLKKWDEKISEKAAVGLAEGANAIRIVTVHSAKGLEYDCVHLVMPRKALDEESDYRWYSAAAAFKDLNLSCVTPKFFPLKSEKELTLSYFDHDYQTLKDAQLGDELNALYVAMTRAKRELIATFQPWSDTSASAVVRKGLEPKCGKLDSKNWNYTEGKPTSKIKKKKSDTEVVEPILIKDYEVFDRLDTWHSTQVAKEQDSPLT